MRWFRSGIQNLPTKASFQWGTLLPTTVPPDPDAVTSLIHRWQAGEDAALDRLLPLVYADLRNMAARNLTDHQGHVTLQPTALVHDVFVRLLEAKSQEIVDSTHLFHMAGRIMRQILVDRARRSGTDKRGGRWRREDLVAAMQLPIPDNTDLERVDEAISALEQVDERLARIVELRYFVGLSVAAVAKVLAVDERTVYRDWALARIWLREHVER